MIYYFSGTGNSRYVAECLASLLNDDTEEITPGMKAETHASCIGIVFPVYAWGMPNIVQRFISGNKDTFAKARYTYCVMTCGDDMGYADHILRKHMGGNLNAAFSVPMPNTYVCLPGFDVDSDEVAQGKVRLTTAMLPGIADCISKGESVTQVTRGATPWIKSYVLRPLFNRFLVTDKHFRATEACNLCKKCVRDCPANNMHAEGGRIQWEHRFCTGCLRCFHACPQRAIEFGAFTKGKRQKQPLTK